MMTLCSLRNESSFTNNIKQKDALRQTKHNSNICLENHEILSNRCLLHSCISSRNSVLDNVNSLACLNQKCETYYRSTLDNFNPLIYQRSSLCRRKRFKSSSCGHSCIINGLRTKDGSSYSCRTVRQCHLLPPQHRTWLVALVALACLVGGAVQAAPKPLISPRHPQPLSSESTSSVASLQGGEE